jgi:diguanylate cyclase (GGDEF)-like protein
MASTNKIKETQINNHIAHIHALDANIYALQSLFYSITASTADSLERDKIKSKISKHINSISTNLSELGYTPCIESLSEKNELFDKLPKLIKELQIQIKNILKQTELRDEYLNSGNKNLPHLALEIRSINSNIPKLFDKMHNLTESLIKETLQRRIEIQNENRRLQEKNSYFELFALIVFGGAFVGLLILSFKQLIRLYRQLETQLKIDPLTHLPNRFALTAQIHRQKNILISIVNINGFRTINELYGSDAGNEVLVRLSQLLNGFAKQNNFELFRIAGDEFAFLASKDSLHVNEFSTLMQTLCQTINAHTFIIKSTDEHIKVSVSCGASQDVSNPLEKADIALQKAKDSNECVIIYDKSLDKEDTLKANRLWIDRIQAGIENDNFIPHFQPVVNNQGVVSYYESLMRLAIKNDNGEIDYHAPVHFLSLAHKIKCYPTLSRTTLLKAFNLAINQKIPISVNLCYKDILNPSLKQTLYEAISKAQIGSMLTFEIIETEDIKNYNSISAFMKDFRSLGVKLALDDFGSGFSNFSYIPHLKPDFIKIDGSLIKELDTNPYACAMVKSICTLCKELEIYSVAEFVHCEAVFEKAKELGVDFFQGYYFSPPISKPKPKDFCFMPKASSSD